MSTPAAAPKKRRTLLKFGIPVLLLLLLAPVGYTWGALSFVYSDGERVGFVQKLSRKGWLCKTWEGELALVNMPGQLSEIFHFTVPDPKIAAELQEMAGHRVALSYEQHKGIPSQCFGETEYFVVRARKAE